MPTPKWPNASVTPATESTPDDVVVTVAADHAITPAFDADPEHALVLAAIASGAVPIFEHNPATDPNKVPNAIDEAAETAAFRELVEAIRQSAEPGTTVTLMDPTAFAKGLT